MAYGDYNSGVDRGRGDPNLFRQPITVPSWVSDTRAWAEGIFDSFETDHYRLDRGARDRLYDRYIADR